MIEARASSAVAPLSALVASGNAYFIAYPHPFELATRIEGEVPAGWTVAEVLREARLVDQTPAYAGILVRRNGINIKPESYETTILLAGDRLIARAIPRGIEAIFAAILSSVTGALVGAGVPSAIAVGIGYAAAAIGTLAIYAGGSYLLSLATNALIGSPDSGGADQGKTKRTSPSASGAGNQLLFDSPVFITCGDVRVFPPYVAMPFQPGFVGGRDQDPAIRMLLGVAGNCLVSEVRLGKIDVALLDIKATSFQNKQTLDFPTAEIKHPGITLRDEWHEPGNPMDWQIVSLSEECDQLSMIWFFQGGLYRTQESGKTKYWQLSFDFEYRVAADGGVPAGAWGGFFARDAVGNPGEWRVPYVHNYQVLGDNRLHLVGETRESFFAYVHRRVLRNRYEVRFRLRSELFEFKSNGALPILGNNGIKTDMWPDDRHPTDNPSNTVQLASDPTLVQFAGFRDEPAVEGFAPGLSGVDIELIDQTTKSDENARISFRSRHQIPSLAAGSPGINNSGVVRTAITTTSNHADWVLFLLTGALAGDTAQPDSKIDFPSFLAAHDYYDELVPTTNGATEVRNRIDCVLDRSGISRLEQCQDILRGVRSRLIRMDGKYHLVVDKKRTAPRMLFAETDILEMESERSWTVIPDMLRVEFFNGEKDGDKDELHVYNDSPAVASVLPNGGYAESTATKTASVTVTRDGDYADIDTSGGWETFPEEGWVCVRWPGGTPFSDARLFLIDGVSDDLLTLRVIDKAASITAGTRTGQFDTTAAQRVEQLSLPYSQRPSECFREARYFLAQKNRPELYKLHIGLEWMGVAQGDMVEVSSAVPVFGRGSGRVLSIAGPATAATGVQMDEEFDLAGLTLPAIKFVTYNGSAIVVNRYDIDAAATATLRAGGDNRWLAFVSAHNVQAAGMRIGDGNGSVGAFGEKLFETKDLIVQHLQMGEDLSATLLCVDHAPEIFDAILDQAPVPRFNSGITETGIGERARPAMPQLSAAVDGLTSPMLTINAAAQSGGAQALTRADGLNWADFGFTIDHKISVEGYANAVNNPVRRLAVTVVDDVLTITNASGVLEAGTGDERVVGVIGSTLGIRHIDRAATGPRKLDVVPQGGGVVWLNGPSGAGVFSGFRGSAGSWIELLDITAGANNGYFQVTSKPSDDRLVLSSTTMVASTGTGSERCHQSQMYRSTGSFILDRLTVGDRTALGGFEQDIEADVFTLRAISTNAVYLDDPFGRLVTEVGVGLETITRVRVPVAYELVSNVSAGDLQIEVTVPLRPGTKSIVTVDQIECRYRLRDIATGRVTGGWISAGTVDAGATAVTFGPIPAGSDWDFAARAISRQKTASDWCCLTGGGRKDRPSAPTHFQVHSDAVATAEGQRFALHAEWAA